ncbi:GlsB/YeaQ/YmgE family stress response membrane protein [Comamonas sp.]|uniref:GlsB/YeaQ/YmgE family stress response membrane protein n=1 Tax=Comamonas sp. TaxID=34028 RepID=UPI0028A132E6|nr:GlsB/YeaQ/YmgE family stress response membrane protein [Comamonas sp.]
MMALLGTLLVGLIVGLIARALKPGDDDMGWIMTIVLGIVGSFLASYAGQAMGLYPPGSSAGWIASIIGAIVVLFLYNLIRSKTK